MSWILTAFLTWIVDLLEIWLPPHAEKEKEKENTDAPPRSAADATNSKAGKAIPPPPRLAYYSSLRPIL